MIFIWADRSVGRHSTGLVVTGGSRITGSISDCVKLFARGRETSGASGPETNGGIMSSGSRKYIHLKRDEPRRNGISILSHVQMHISVPSVRLPLLWTMEFE